MIASDLPTSGYDIPPGVQNAIKLAISQHPEIGRFKVAYEPLDDGLAEFTSPIKAVQNVKRMIVDSRVLATIGTFTSNAAFSAIPIANAAGLAMLSPSNTGWCLTLPSPICNPQPSGLRRSGPNNYFRIVAPDPFQGRAMARYAAHTLAIKKVAVFDMSDDFEDVAMQGFIDEFKRDGGAVVLSAALGADTVNFRGFLQAARAEGAEAIFAATESDAACDARAQMAGIFPADSYFLGMDRLQEQPDCISRAKDYAQRMLSTVSVLDLSTSRNPDAQKIVDSYKLASPHGPSINVYAFTAYDCALILIQAITKAVNENGGNFPTRPQVVDQLAHSQFQGLGGSYSFDANGDALAPVMALYQVNNGQWMYVSQIDASAAA